jgi:hypothetical protein
VKVPAQWWEGWLVGVGAAIKLYPPIQGKGNSPPCAGRFQAIAVKTPSYSQKRENYASYFQITTYFSNDRGGFKA